MENSMVVNGSLDSHANGSAQIRGVVEEKYNLKVDFLEDFESYWRVINERLTISRMVNDSVIRGMVKAVEQEATEKIAQKELEIAGLRETLHLFHVGADENETLESHLIHNEYSSFHDAFIEHERFKGSLADLKTTAGTAFKMLTEELNKIRGMDPMKGDVAVWTLGLGGIREGNVSGKWMGVDKMLDWLKTTLDTAFTQINDMVQLSKESLLSWRQEHTFQEEMEQMVIASFVRSLKEEFEQKLWEQSAEFCSNEFLSSFEKIKGISSLRQELDSIAKSLSAHENGHPISLDCLENGEERNQNRMDRLHRKASECHISHCSLWEADGKHEDLVTSTSENFDSLRRLSRDELISRFKTEMNNMKRDHDYKMQELTEDNFRLKREYLKLKESPSLHVKKDKEFDAVRNKIPDIILKLDMILLENEKLATFGNNDTLGTLKSRLDSLLLENRQLKILVSDKEREVNHLSLQVSDAANKILLLSRARENLSKVIGKLESVVEDSQIEASITENVYGCLLRELMDKIKCISEESDLECLMVQEVYDFVVRDIISRRASETQDGFEDSYFDSSIIKELYLVICKEALNEAKEKLDDLNMRFVDEKKTQGVLETVLLERENALRLETEEKERLKEHVLSLNAWVEEMEKLAQKAEDALTKETEKLGLASQELSNLRNIYITQHERAILERNEESRVANNKFVEALEKIKASELKSHELRRKHVLAREELKKTNEEKAMLLAAILENQEKLSLADANEKEYRKQIKSLSFLFTGLVKQFPNLECIVAENIQKNDLRLKNLCHQVSSLTDQVGAFKAAESMYKQQLERKSSDLQKAEAEVDLLGDEVDAFWDLLEKIYIALDHYSPILKHYPGIIETLKLVRRQLSGE